MSVKQMSNVNEGLSDIEKLKDNEGRLRLSRNSEMPTEFSVKAPNIELTGKLHVQNEGKHPWPI